MKGCGLSHLRTNRQCETIGFIFRFYMSNIFTNRQQFIIDHDYQFVISFVMSRCETSCARAVSMSHVLYPANYQPKLQECIILEHLIQQFMVRPTKQTVCSHSSTASCRPTTQSKYLSCATRVLYPQDSKERHCAELRMLRGHFS